MGIHVLTLARHGTKRHAVVSFQRTTRAVRGTPTRKRRTCGWDKKGESVSGKDET
jgi:hypothetical protein